MAGKVVKRVGLSESTSNFLGSGYPAQGSREENSLSSYGSGKRGSEREIGILSGVVESKGLQRRFL